MVLKDNKMTAKLEYPQSSINELEVLLVLCSMTKDRYEIAKRVVNSISFFFETTGCKLWVLDNGSKYKINANSFPRGTSIIKLGNNIGYWGALHWFLNSNLSPIYKTNKKYLYIIESDNIHFDIFKLHDVVKFMEFNLNINCVRVSEFSVKNRLLYSKEAKFLPYRKNRSLVSLINHITNEKAKFWRTSKKCQVYFSNLHSKLPSVLRLEILRIVFQQLAELNSFDEKDFYTAMHSFSDTIGVLDSGIYYTVSSESNSRLVQSGSYGINYLGGMDNYFATRLSSISNQDLSTKISSLYEIK
jgi:hypothetical protein